MYNQDMETIKIYIYGCNCGVVKRHVYRVQKYGLDTGKGVQVLNTLYSGELRAEHAAHLIEQGMTKKAWLPIVVDGAYVTELLKW